jgi:hypothetical protein
VDNEPPRISALSANPSVLWPPDNKLRDVTLTAVATDNCELTNRKILSITSNETSNRPERQWEITGDLTARLRASRLSSSRERIYTITVECTDHSGNTATKSVTVTVPRNQNQ